MPRFTRMIYYSLMLFFLLACKNVQAQESLYPPYDPDIPEMQEIQKTIDASMDDIEDSLRIRGTFQPFATVILQNDSIADIHVISKNGAAISIPELEEELSINALNGTYKVVSIFYLEDSVDPAATSLSRVVKVHAEHTNDDFAYRFEFPYSRNTKHQITFGETSADFEPQVMFKP